MRISVSFRNLVLWAGLLLSGCDVFFSAPGKAAGVSAVDAGGWRELGSPGTGLATGLALAACPGGAVYAASVSDAMTNQPTLYRLLADGSWATVGPIASDVTATFLRLAIDTSLSAAGDPVAYFADLVTGDILSRRYDTAIDQWTSLSTLVPSAGSVNCADAATSAAGSTPAWACWTTTPTHYAYVDGMLATTNSSSTLGRVSVLDLGTSAWIAAEHTDVSGVQMHVPGGSVWSDAQGTLISGYSPGFDLFAHNGEPFVAYAEGDVGYRLWLRRWFWDGGTWTYENICTTPGNDMGVNGTVTAVSDGSAIYVACDEYDGSHLWVRVVRFAGGTWTDLGRLGGGMASYINIAFDPVGKAVLVSFVDGSVGQLARVFRIAV